MKKYDTRYTTYLLSIILLLLSGQSCTDEKPEVLKKAVMVNQTTGHDYVDLGLSVCWATCNIGASTPYEHGGLYAWGELDAKKSYNGWATYKWCNGTSRTMTKYNNYSDYGYNGFVDDIKVLDPVDDIASVMWGDGWRMPTRDEFNELINNCTWEWISIDDIEGYYVTSCVPGFTDRSIFIPASGGDWGGGARRTMHQGFYRSAEACVIPARTVILYFNKDTYGIGDGNERYLGFPVRAVKQVERSEETTLILSRNVLCIEVGMVDALTATVKQKYQVIDASVKYSSSDNSIATVSASGRIMAISRGTCLITAESEGAKAECRVYVTSGSVVPQMVDLGLSVKWASFNIGADSPEQVGYYLAWGETAAKSTYNRFTYKFCTGTYSTQTFKYCNNSDYGTRDDRLKLEPEDDVATALWGGNWRIPTLDEMEELRDKCTWTWTSYKGIKGYQVTSNVKGYTDRSIFIPATGECGEEGQMGVEYVGHYWTSSISDAGHNSSWDLYFNQNATKMLGGNRFYGYCIRPVASDNKLLEVPELVDLGLSVNWASFNLGASNPEEYGDYLSWGEIYPKGYYTTYSYKYQKDEYLKMIEEDNISGTEYDAAHVRLGGDWRIPTKEEYQELVNNCTWTWQQYDQGKYGMKVTGPNGNSIFLPAGGYPNPSWVDVGTYGTYWTSSSSTYRSDNYMGSNYCYYFRFNSDIYEVTNYEGATYVGQLIRPVCTSLTYQPPKDTMAVTGYENGYGYVDLGLSVKWASYNVGALVPEDFGDYYAWGDFETYYEAGYAQEDPQNHWVSGKSDGYQPKYYKYGNGSNYDYKYFKYCNDVNSGYNGFFDGKTTLEMEDDVAHVKWGGDWRMPTNQEFMELSNSDNCNWEWTTLSDVNGFKVTSKKPGYTQNAIFLPVAGFRNYKSLSYLGTNGYYWSSSLGTDQEGNEYAICAWYLEFGANYHIVYSWGVGRFFGLTVRPVCPI